MEYYETGKKEKNPRNVLSRVKNLNEKRNIIVVLNALFSIKLH